MTEVSFYTGVPERLAYACRLLRKAVLSGAKVTVCGPAPALDKLDRQLWSFDATEFVPHLRWSADRCRGLSTAMQDTPVWLIEQADLSPHHDILLNLGDELQPGYESFGRVLELVTSEPGDAEAGRKRFRAYKAQGLSIKHHQVTQ